jgi:hypothetical protein
VSALGSRDAETDRHDRRGDCLPHSNTGRLAGWRHPTGVGTGPRGSAAASASAASASAPAAAAAAAAPAAAAPAAAAPAAAAPAAAASAAAASAASAAPASAATTTASSTAAPAAAAGAAATSASASPTFASAVSSDIDGNDGNDLVGTKDRGRVGHLDDFIREWLRIDRRRRNRDGHGCGAGRLLRYGRYRCWTRSGRRLRLQHDCRRRPVRLQRLRA